MKKSILTLCTFLFVGMIYAQKPLDWQNFDKSVKEKSFLDPVTYGEFCTFKIININKFFYEVKIEGTKVELETPIPTELQQLFRLSPEELSATKDEESSKEAQEKNDELEKVIESKTEKDNEEFTKISDENREKLDTAASKFHKEYATYLNKIQTLKATRIKLINLAKMDVSADKMKSLVLAIENPENIENLLKNLNKSYFEYKSALLSFHEEVEEALVAEEAKKNLLDLNLFTEELKALYESIDEDADINLYADVIYLYTELQNDRNFTVVAPPVQAKEDLINYSVSITPSKVHSLGAYQNPMKFDFDVPVYGGLKLDFSVGPVFSFGKNAKDDHFYLEETAVADTSTLRQYVNQNFLTPNIAAMMHAYLRSGSVDNFGFMFGVGAGFEDIENVNLSYFLGGSFLSGEKRKLMISGGVSLLKVDRLKIERYTIGNDYLTSSVDLSDITEKVYKPSFFLSVSVGIAQRRNR